MEESTEYQQPWDRVKLRAKRICDLDQNDSSRTDYFTKFYFTHQIKAGSCHGPNQNIIYRDNEISIAGETFTQLEWDLILEEMSHDLTCGPNDLQNTSVDLYCAARAGW